jgi:hypothetical protein
MKSAIIRYLPAAGLIYLLLSLLYFGTVGDYGCFFGAITWAIFLAFATEEERRRLWTVAGEIFLAAGIMAVVAAPFLYFAMQNWADIPSQIHDPEVFSHDPLNTSSRLR